MESESALPLGKPVWEQERALYALVLRLTVGGTYEVNPEGGRFVHAAFLDMIRDINPTLSEHLHGTNDRKPYTTSPIWGAGSVLREGEEAFVRFAILDPSLAGQFVQKFLLYGPKQGFRLAGVPFAITHVHLTPTGHARAGIFSIKQPDKTGDPVRTMRVDFLTPTAFSRNHGSQSKYETGMLPSDLWGYARRQWELAGGESPGRAYDDWVAVHTEVLRMNTRRNWVDFQRFKMPGIVGYSIYKLTGCDLGEPNAVWWRHFARLMPYTSLGAKTTMGLGQCIVTAEG